ncbi:phage tail protein [Metasolibacillus sp. FSL K6-0083]|uniref:phage tail protein n=1 Tax=Metasolibacillus sp. FSL K6-0083 TaxID=2921416 RepID=UPI003159A8B8
MTQYGTIITNIGLAQIANAQVTQQKVGLEHIALGDGNGSYYIPTANQSALVNEVWRGPVSNVTIDPANDNRIIIEGLIPTTAGGFTIREIAVFDDQNQLIAVGQYPEKYKPQLSEGVAEETLIQFVIETNNVDAVELSIDPTIIIASREYVDEKVATVSAGLVQLEEDFTTHLDNNVKHINYAVASGTNNYIVSITGIESFVEGLSIKVKFTNGNTAASTLNVNGLGAKDLVKSNGSALANGNIKAGQILHLVYTGINFQLLGEGGEYGNAVAADVLSGKTIGTEDGVVSGTMPNRGAVNQNLAANGSYTIPEGYHNGSGKVTQSLTTQAAQTITPGTTNKTIAANRYLTGVQTILGDTNLIPANILQGVNIFGVIGSLVKGKKVAGNIFTVEQAQTLWTSAQYLDYSNREFTTPTSLEITNLGFKPGTIVVVMVGQGVNANKIGLAVYTGDNNPLLCATFQTDLLEGATPTTNRSVTLKPNTGSSYVTASGFRLPIAQGSMIGTVTWLAVEP